MQFSSLLLRWYNQAHRDLPWRRTSDPYAIWVSEIMLQQTRVAAVIPFYERFLARFPNPEALASAAEDDLLAAWAGLGYYSRVRNMQKAARQMHGAFPSTYEAIRALPGIGDYTAAAIASIAFNLPYAAVDGNVLRVLSRFTSEAGDIGSGVVKARLTQAADQLLDREEPGRYNQALMELGATLCLPRSPQCLVCPVSALCKARNAGRQNELPVRIRRVATVRLRRRVFVVQSRHGLLLWQRRDRAEKLAGFWELPEPEHFSGGEPCGILVGEFRHSITHHQYLFEVVAVRVKRNGPATRDEFEFRYISAQHLGNLPLSTTTRKALALYFVGEEIVTRGTTTDHTG